MFVLDIVIIFVGMFFIEISKIYLYIAMSIATILLIYLFTLLPKIFEEEKKRGINDFQPTKKSIKTSDLKEIKKRHLITNIVMSFILLIFGIYLFYGGNTQSSFYVIMFTLIYFVFSIYQFKSNRLYQNAYYKFVTYMDPKIKRQVYFICLGFFFIAGLFGTIFQLIENTGKLMFTSSMLIISTILILYVWFKS